ncbi:MAG: hypothetical protein ACRDPY_28315 [Streptosporangiaceae bacterium]
MPNGRKQGTGYLGAWALSYIIPIGVGLLFWLPTHSAAAGVVGVVTGFAVWALAVRRR